MYHPVLRDWFDPRYFPDDDGNADDASNAVKATVREATEDPEQ
jgi:hypothetical protein